MSVRVTLISDRIGCYVEVMAPPELGWATLAETRAEAKKAGWKHVRNTRGQRRYDNDFCPDHDSVMSAEKYQAAADSISDRGGAS